MSGYEEQVAHDVRALLGEAEECGDTFVASDDFGALPYPRQWVRRVAREMIAAGELVVDTGGEVYRAETFRAEIDVGVGAGQHDIRVIVGPAGSGKTTSMRCEIAEWGGPVVLLAPTGKAARRLSEATRREASTIHRRLGLGVEPGAVPSRSVSGLVVVDEASMLDVHTGAALVRALTRGSRLLLVGDAHQLPSVGNGRVLASLVESGCVPVEQLRRVWRQARDSPILQRSKALRNGRGLDLRPDASWTHLDYSGDAAIAHAAHLAAATGAMALAATRWAVSELNRQIQSIRNPGEGGFPAHDGSYRYRAGDPVIFARNDYAKGVTNGQPALVCEADEERLIVTSDGETYVLRSEDVAPDALTDRPLLLPGYALTAHKSQGSEWDHVIVVVPSDSRLLSREWLYTAVTRARERVTVIGDHSALQVAAKRRVRRKDKLATRLRQAGCGIQLAVRATP